MNTFPFLFVVLVVLFVLGFSNIEAQSNSTNSTKGGITGPRLGLPFVTKAACATPPQQEKMAEIAKKMADLIKQGLDKSSVVVSDPAKKEKYVNVSQKITDAFKAGWNSPDIIENLSSSLSDPLKEIQPPKVGETVAAGVKLAIKSYLTYQKTLAGC